ncbi:MAG: bile acid:sodium symporter family protein [Treponema sp.]|jgi:predicted Na+-dependent transporter|nr:bile acid:sodium symporter family protein [Treponema sp.]
MQSKKQPAEIAGAINTQLERFMPIITPFGIVMGFLFPGVFIKLRPLVIWLFSTITLSGALKLKTNEFGRTLRSPLVILLAFVFMHVIMPLIALLLSTLVFGGDIDTVSGFILVYSAPTAVSGFIWTSMYGGNFALCLTLILIDTILAPFVVPGTMFVLVGTRVALDMTAMAVSLILMVVAPTIVGVSANELSKGKIPALVCPYLAPISKISLVLVIAANTSPVAPRVRFDNPRIWLIAVLCVSLAAIGYIFSKLLGIMVKLPPEKRVTIFFSGGLRNISAVTTIAVSFFPEAAALPALLGIVFQQSTAAIMGRLLMGKRKG